LFRIKSNEKSSTEISKLADTYGAKIHNGPEVRW